MFPCVACKRYSVIELPIKPITYIQGYKVEATGLEICGNCSCSSKSFYELPQLLRLIDSLSYSCCPPDAVVIKYEEEWKIL